MSAPLTLRDARRLVSRGRPSAWLQHALWQAGVTSWRDSEILADLDRRISAEGPSAPLMPRRQTAEEEPCSDPEYSSTQAQPSGSGETADAGSPDDSEGSASDGGSDGSGAGRGGEPHVGEPTTDATASDGPAGPDSGDTQPPGGDVSARPESGADGADTLGLQSQGASAPTAGTIPLTAEPASVTLRPASQDPGDDDAETGESPVADDGRCSLKRFKADSHQFDIAKSPCSSEQGDPSKAADGSRPKGTSECHPGEGGGEAADTHGGDGASGEVDGGMSGVGAGRHNGAHRQHGGVFAHLAAKCAGRAKPANTAELRGLLTRVLDRMDVGTAGITSPRISGRRLVRELASRRMALSRARRTEMEPARKIILCDVSGSCSATCAELLLAAEAIARHDDTVSVVVHSNGHVEDAIGWLGPHVEALQRSAHTAEAWDRALSGAALAGVVAFGDQDACWLYAHLVARGARLVWLDSYSACAGVRRAPRHMVDSAGVGACDYIVGVHDAVSSARALRLVLAER